MFSIHIFSIIGEKKLGIKGFRFCLELIYKYILALTKLSPKTTPTTY